MSKSPYAGKPESSWSAITRRLVARHPLKPDVLLEIALVTWERLWQTSVGSGETTVHLSSLNVPATVVGYFFEVLFARELERRFPKQWRGSQSKEEKDLVYVSDSAQSIEIKSSGQCGFRIFGNRSYAQKAANELLVKKEKSGYYLTVNFFGQTLTLLRFGWIDADDWAPQKAQTGQMSGLPQAVYKHKLMPIAGTYRQHAPLILLDGVGPSVALEFTELGIRTIGELLAHSTELPARLERIKSANAEFLTGCYGQD